MNKLKVFLIKIGLIVPPAGFKFNPIDTDGDGIVQEGTEFERKIKKAPAKKKPVKKKAPAKKKAVKKAKKKAK